VFTRYCWLNGSSVKGKITTSGIRVVIWIPRRIFIFIFVNYLVTQFSLCLGTRLHFTNANTRKDLMAFPNWGQDRYYG
jgi:hypothetical protein